MAPDVPLDRRAFLALVATGMLACSTDTSTHADADRGGTDSVAGTTPPTIPAIPTTTAPPATTAPSTTIAPTSPRFVVSGPASAPMVALTFHTNGALDMVRSVLGIVEARHVPITAFIVGTWLDANPTMAARFAQGGHDLGNHTWSHLSFASLAAAQMESEVVRCRDTLARLTGNPSRWFRTSGTSNGTAQPSPPEMATSFRAGYPTLVGFDVDPADYADPGANAVRDRTLATVKAGSIVSLHMGHSGTIAALPAILDGLEQRRLQPVTLRELLA